MKTAQIDHFVVQIIDSDACLASSHQEIEVVLLLIVYFALEIFQYFHS